MTLDSKIPEGDLADKWDNHKFSIKLVNPANKRRLFDGLTSLIENLWLSHFSARSPSGIFESSVIRRIPPSKRQPDRSSGTRARRGRAAPRSGS